MGRQDDLPSRAQPPQALLNAWLDQTNDLLALTDAAGHITWANGMFERATGLSAGGALLQLAPGTWRDGAPLCALRGVLEAGHSTGIELHLVHAGNGTALYLDVRAVAVGSSLLWTLADRTALQAANARARLERERLEVARDFGRLGIWEREIQSSEGHWDRNVFEFWGLDPAGGTPNYEEASRRVHPDDHRTGLYAASVLKAGRYEQHYRVLRPDGGVRRIHSQWEVKNSPEGVPDRVIGIMVDDTEVYELARSLDNATTQMRLAAEAADIVLWRHDLATGLLHYNDHGFKVLGVPYRTGGLTIEEARSYTHPDDVGKLATSAAQALGADRPIDVETRHRAPDGSWRNMLVRRVVERNTAGQPVAYVGVSLDVTERAAHSRRVEQLAQHLEATARAARLGIWTTSLGTTETEWNAQMFELFELDPTKPPPTLAEWLAQCVHPDEAECVGNAVRAYMRARQGVFEIEFRVRTRDASNRWMVLRADLDRSNTSTLRVFGIAMDVTDRRTAQAALHTANERAALIARHAGIGTWESEDIFKPARWDEQMFRLRGLEPRAVSPTPEERLAMTHPEDRALVLDAHPELHASRQSTAYEFRIRWPDGSYRWIASRSAPLLDAGGNLLRRVGVNWDVTDQKNAELARQQALLAERESQAKSQFLSRMSHELRTPLNAVLGFTQLLQLDARQHPDAGRLAKLNHIRAAGEHLLTLINDALDLSSLEAGTLKLDLQPVSIALAVARALPLVEESAAARRIAIRTGRLSGSARADATRLHQVLLNLLSNAVKYNRDGGEIVLESQIAGADLRLSVRDTGRGMRPEQLAHLFEPFNRLGLEGEGIEGSGIGMTIARALVEGMGGRIVVSSEFGIGTVFEVHLPNARADAGDSAWLADLREQSVLADPAALPSPEGRAGQLLYIEDNAVNVLLVEELVRQLPGLRVASEGTGAAGVARARSLLPDLILVDVQLPDFDGFEVLRQLRAHAETARIPSIALSANAMPADIERALAAGFEDYWTKPIRFKEFIDALKRRFPPMAQPAAGPPQAG
ncbi:MAG: PAS domain-containing protein [Burkholderiales bacterium]